MSRKKYLLLPGAALAAALLLAQQEHPAEDADVGIIQPDTVWDEIPSDGGRLPEKGEQLTVSVSLDNGDFAELEERSKLWSSRHPGLEIKLENEPPATGDATEWRRRALLGEDGDVVLVPSGEIVPLAAAGVLLPLDKLMAGSPGFGGSGAFWEQLYWNGYLWGVPRDADPDVLVWNDAELRKAGLLQPPKGWEELAGLAAGHPGTASVLVGREDAGAAAAWLAAWKPEAGLQMLPQRLKEALLGWGESGGTLRAYSAYKEAESLMAGGKAFAVILPWSEYMRWNPGNGYTPDYRLPLDADSLRMRSYAVTASSVNPDAAAAWIAGMTEPSAQQAIADVSSRLLPLQSLYDGGPDGQGSPPADWKPQLFQSKAVPAGGSGAALLEPLWKSFWAAGGKLSPEQLAAAWLDAIENKPS